LGRGKGNREYAQGGVLSACVCMQRNCARRRDVFLVRDGARLATQRPRKSPQRWKTNCMLPYEAQTADLDGAWEGCEAALSMPVVGSRLVFIYESAGTIRGSGRATHAAITLPVPVQLCTT